METVPKIPRRSEEVREAAEICKKKGNEHFKAKDFPASIQCYSQAIAIDASDHVFFGNRSAAYAANGDWTLAIADARESVDLNPGYTKGFYRLAQAHMEMGETSNARSAIESGLLVDPSNKEMLALKRKVASRIAAEREDEVRGFSDSLGRANLAAVSLYPEKEDADASLSQDEPNSDARALKGMLRSLKDSGPGAWRPLGDSRAHELEGMFQKLTEPEQFRRILMPGLSEEERTSAPSSLQELLRSPLYSSAVEESLPRIVTQAASVLRGVKERGRMVGDIMDAATEEALKPQVLQEAFAHEVVSVVTAVHAKARAKAASERGKLALPSDKKALWEQLNDTTVAGLRERGKGFAVQDLYLGAEWVSVLLKDSLRFQRTGKMSPGGIGREHGEMAWVEPDQLEYGYPALHELLLNLHALPFELNHKEPSLRLSCPFRGSTMLLRLTEGCRFPPRLDSFAAGAETGHRISAVYFISRTGRDITPAPTTGEQGASEVLATQSGGRRGEGGQLRLQNVEAAPRLESEASSLGADVEAAGVVSQGIEVEPTADRLVLFRSDRVSTETLQVLGKGQEQYAVLFWMHGAKAEKLVESEKQ